MRWGGSGDSKNGGDVFVFTLDGVIRRATAAAASAAVHQIARKPIGEQICDCPPHLR